MKYRLTFIMAPILATRLEMFPPYRRELDRPWLNTAIMAATVTSMIFFFPSAAQLQQRVDETFPTAALDYMQRQHLNGRIINEPMWAATWSGMRSNCDLRYASRYVHVQRNIQRQDQNRLAPGAL